MRKISLFILTFMLLMGAVNAHADADPKAYAVLSTDNKTMTFYYDVYSDSRSGTVYYNMGTANAAPSWHHTTSSPVTTVVFDASFADFHPTCCHCWFENMNNLTTITGIGNLKTDEVTSMCSMFSGCSKLENIDVSGFNTDKVTDMAGMFDNCSKLTSLDVSRFNTGHVSRMSYMFRNCSNLRNLDVSGFYTQSVGDMEAMFQGCSSLTSLDVKDFNPISPTANHMFEGCSSLRSLDLRKMIFDHRRSDDVLKGCSSLRKLYVNSTSDDLGAEACLGVGTESSPCDLIYPEGISPEPTAIGSIWILWKSGYFNIQRAYAVISNDRMRFYYDYNIASRTGKVYDLNNDDTSPRWYFFNEHRNVRAVYFDSSFAKYRPTTCYRWFSDFVSLTSFYGLENFHTEDVTNMQYMFENCTSLESIDLSGYNTEKVVNMSYMFSGCSGLTSLDVNSLESDNVENIRYMFKDCSSLTSLDVSEFAPHYLLDMKGMFSGCSGLTSLDLSRFSISDNEYSSELLNGCTSLKSLTTGLYSLHMNSNACMGVGSVESPCTLYNFSGSAPQDSEDIGGGLFRWNSGIFKEKPKAYVILSEDKKSFAFYYDSFSKIRVGTQYDLDDSNVLPDWYNNRSYIERVLFSPSFADYRPESCHTWFFGMYNLTQIFYIENLKTDEVTNMYGMFYEIKDSGLDLSGFNTSKVTDMGLMFGSCENLLSVDVSSFNTSKVTNMDKMFKECRSLTSLDLSSFTFNSDCSTSEFLMSCSSLQTLIIPSTANNINSNACSGVGTENAPCTLVCPSGFNLEKDAEGDGWFMWKGGYFKLPSPESYVVLNGTTLSFYYDTMKNTRPGTKYSLNRNNEVPGWSEYSSTVTRVEFDPSFAHASPRSCFGWFNGMSNLTAISLLRNLKTSQVSNMASMFAGCSNLKNLDLSHFSTNWVTDMSDMFKGCSSLESIDVSSFNTARVTNMKNMFYGCSSLESIDLSGFETEVVTDMSSMFLGCTGLTRLDLSNFTFNFTSGSTASQNFLKNCSGLQTLIIPETAGNLYATACTGVGTQSAPCTLLYPNGFLTTSGSGWYRWKDGYFKDAPKVYAVLNGSTLTFYYDYEKNSRTGTVYELNTGYNTPGWYSSSSSVTTVVFDQSFADTRPTSCSYWFSGMYNLTTITDIGNLKTDKVTSMLFMFSNCSKLTSLDVSGFNTTNVRDMHSMFDACRSLTSLDVSGFNTEKVSSMRSMFSGCSGLESLDLRGFDTKEVTNMESMFNGCSNLESLDVSGFNTAKVTYMPTMFYNCSRLTNLDVSGFDTKKVTNMRALFANCSGLTSLDLSSFTFNNGIDTYNFLYSCSGLKTLTIPETADNLDSGACTGVGTQSAPCILIYPNSFTLNPEVTGSGWYKWKSGYFNDAPKAYAVFNGSTLTFYYDNNYDFFSGSSNCTVYELSTGDYVPGWNSNRTSVTSVVFDQTFADARPTNCFYWFAGMTNLTTITGIGNLMTDDVTNMSNMFAGCSGLTSLDVSGFNTDNVTNMANMFYGCSKLTSLDLSSFTFNESIPTDNFLSYCSGLKTLTIPASAIYLNATACTGVGTQSAPCTFIYPDDFTPETTSTGDGWYVWMGGYFKDLPPDSYAVLEGSTLTFYCDHYKTSRTTGTVYVLNKAFAVPGWFTNRTSITSVVFDASFANARPTTCYYWFYGMTNLTDITNIINLKTDEVTNTSYMFYKCSSLTSLDVSNFNTANVTNMSYMFYGCSNLTSLDAGGINTTNVTNMSYMFYGCSKLESLDVGGINTANVTNMSYMFYGCSKLESLDVSGFNTEKVVHMNGMFRGCSMLESLGVSRFNTENVANMSYMFHDCSNLMSLDVGGFITDNVANMSYMFYGCKGLTSLDVGGFNTANVTNMSYMFNGCSGLTSLNVSGFNTAKVTDMSFMFCGCSGLTNLNMSNFSTAIVTNMSNMFYSCSGLTSLDVSGFNTENVTNMSGMFQYCTNLTSLDLSNFNTASVKNMYNMFYSCSGLTSLDVSGFNTDKVTNMASMFKDCSCLRSLNVGGFNTANVANMSGMFQGCTNLTSLDLSNFNTASVTNMSYMFNSCSGLTSLDLSSFTFNDGTNTYYFLYRCSGLKTLTIPETADNLNSNACTGVGTQAAPCALIYPEGFTPETTGSGSDWYRWKGGYFKDASNLRGDTNGDGNVSLIDVMQVVSYILDDVPEGFIFANAEMDGDNIISLTDLMMIVSIILEQPTASIPASARESAFDVMALTAKGSRCTLHLDNSEPCRGISFTVNLPEGGTMGNVTVPVSRADGHHAHFNAVAPGRYNVVVYANSGKPLRDGTTAMLRFDISGCQADDITVSDIQMVNNWNETVLLPATYGITTGMAVIDDSDSDDSQPWYNTVGVGSSKPTRGVNIHNGKKIVVK